MDATVSILVAGLGGQGILHLSKILAVGGRQAYRYACRSEFRGLSQRGGSVQSVVRFGSAPLAPVLDHGGADLLLSLDGLETVRALDFVKDSGIVLSSSVAVPPLHLLRSWQATGQPCGMKRDFQDHVLETLAHNAHCHSLDITHLARKAGDPKAENMVLLGAASWFLPLAPESLCEAMRACTKASLRKTMQDAIGMGREATRTFAEKMRSPHPVQLELATAP